MKILCHILFYAFIAIQSLECKNYGTSLVDTIRYEFLILEDQLWNDLFKEITDQSTDPTIEILTKFQNFDKRIQQMPQDLLYGMQIEKQSDYFLIYYSDVRVVHELYEKFRRCQNESIFTDKKDDSDYKREISVAAIIDDILYNPISNIHKMLLQIHDQTKTLLDDVFNIVTDKEFRCKTPAEPAQQAIYNLYNLFSLTNLKGYILTQFAFMASRLQGKGNYTVWSINTRDKYEKKVQTTYRMFKWYMDNTNSEIYRCDPKIHVEGTTYTQLTRLLQATIQQEADLNDIGTCTDTCEKYYYTRSYGCYDSSSDYCKNVQPCNGEIYNCGFIQSHMKTCISNSKSNRRFEYIEYDGGRTLGVKTNCYRHSIYSWYRWFVHCSYCLCYCDEQGSRSDRYFNLRPSNADVTNNRVITGMRFIKRNRIIHIQIQEGKLLPYGYIDQNTVRWVPVDEYRITDYNVRSGTDYHTMNFNQRVITLDKLKVPDKDYLITGIKFFVQFSGQYLLLEITATPFNFTTGKLNIENAIHINNKYGSWSKIYINQPDIPTRSPPSKPDFESQKYVQFTHSDLDKDAAQTTIPFIDIQPVNAEPAVPLQSARIYYKGSPGYGGFVGLNIETHKYMDHMQYSFPTRRVRNDPDEKTFTADVN